MLILALICTELRSSTACIQVPPTGPPTTTITPPPVEQCPCLMNLYDPTLCPATGMCNTDPNAVTYTTGPNCQCMLNCEMGYHFRIRFTDGTFLNNVKIRDFHTEQHSIVCRNGQWIYTAPAEPFGRAISKLVCYETAIIQAEPKHNIKARSPPTCKQCSAIKNNPGSTLCPQSYRCSEPMVKTAIDTKANCENTVIECPGSELMVQLKSGSSMIVYSRDVRCDGEWTFDDGHHSHQVENMLCLNKEEQSAPESNCSCLYPSPKEVCSSSAACGITTLYNFPNDCVSQIRCQAGNLLIVNRRQENGEVTSREQVVAGSEPSLLCMNGVWVLNNSGQEIELENGEFISCESSKSSKLSASPAS